MTRNLLALALFACVVGGFAAEASAVGPCSTVCSGPNEPCSLKCYLPGPFVTTCGQLVGQCVNPATEVESVDAASILGSCELGAEITITAEAMDASAIPGTRFATWLRRGVELIGAIVAHARPELT